MTKNILTLIFMLCSLFATAQAEINLIWQVDRTKFWEEDWIMELLDGVDLNIIDDMNYAVHKDHSIIIIPSNISKNEQTKLNNYFLKLRNKKYKFGVIHLSDEYYTAPTQYYKDAKFVFRTFWHDKFQTQKNVTCFAIGYKKGFWADGKIDPPLASERPYTWSFAGQLVDKPTRQFMVNQMKNVPNYHIHETFTWNDPNALGVKDYRDLLLNTIFIPCATGWVNLDTYRLYESLECGCIPIVENQPFDYFYQFFGETPFITISSWENAPSIINGLLANPRELEELRLRCKAWWTQYKQDLHAKFVAACHQIED